jgi:hypothetical protein
MVIVLNAIFWVMPDQGIAARQFPACEAQKMRHNDWKKVNADAPDYLPQAAPPGIVT